MSEEERAKLIPEVDPDAVERLMGMVPPENRAEILRHFQYPVPGQPWGWLFGFDDPRLQAVLEEVWVPAWEDAPDEVLEQGGLPHPGREIALRRREERRRTEQAPRDPPVR